MKNKIKLLWDSAFYKKPKTDAQAGRSMVEILGVLTIIGILSLGALAGYHYAMDRHRANATINDINLRRIDIMIQLSKNMEPNLDEWDETSTVGYTFYDLEMYEDSVAMTIGILPKRVCEMVLDGIIQETIQIDINRKAINNDTVCNVDNEMTFYFPLDGSVDEGDIGQNGCPSHSPAYNEETQECENCPQSAPIFNFKTGECEPCPQSAPIYNAAEGKCEPCPISNQIYNQDTKTCECPKDLPIVDVDLCVQCLSNAHCEGDKFCFIPSGKGNTEPHRGECRTYSIAHQVESEGKNFMLVAPAGTWAYTATYWTARNLCEKIGAQMIVRSDIFSSESPLTRTAFGTALVDWKPWWEAWVWEDTVYSAIGHFGTLARGSTHDWYYNGEDGGVMFTVCKK